MNKDKNSYYRLLLLDARAGDTASLERLFDELKPMVNSVARRYFLNGGDQADLVQEGMIGLYKAFLSYDITEDKPFLAYAKKCVVSQVISAVRSSLALKNSFLSEYISLSDFNLNEAEDTEGIPSTEATPEDVLERREDSRELSTQIRQHLSEFEWRVLGLFLAGLSYKNIADRLDKNTKSIDNAIVRIKNKLKFLEK